MITAVTNPGAGGTATIELDVYSWGDLSAGFPAGWTKETPTPVQVTVPAPLNKFFYRLNANQS